MNIKFLGAAGTVTGSKYLVRTKRHSYLVDCGLFQGPKDLRLRNWQDPLGGEKIDAVFLTHAHVDHSGYIPRLIKRGFSGPIYCSYGTYDLCKILLPDSGHLQEEEAFYANKKNSSIHKPALPLYTQKEAEYALNYFKPVAFHKPIKIKEDATITFSRAGHILGASCILLELAARRIGFSGDVGRFNDLVMRGPEPMPDADYLVLESTYGDRDHVDEDLMARMAAVINETINRKGTVVIPAFAVGRAQTILYIVHELKKNRKIPDIKTYLDSPMAINATDLYCAYANEHRLNTRACQEMFGEALITKTPEESRGINEIREPKIIVSASGMASGGRVLHHLARYLGDPKNVIVIVGFQAAGTRGRQLLDGASEIKIFGSLYPVAARVDYIPGLSAHADSSELIRWLKNSPIKHPKVFITHGEKDAALALAKKLQESFHWQVEIPKDNEEFEL